MKASKQSWRSFEKRHIKHGLKIRVSVIEGEGLEKVGPRASNSNCLTSFPMNYRGIDIFLRPCLSDFLQLPLKCLIYCCRNRRLPPKISISSVQFSHSVMSDSLQPHELQHARPPCPSPTPRDHSNSHPSSRWCHRSYLILCRPLLLLPPIPPRIRVFSNESTLQMRWPKYSSFSFSIIPSKEHPGLISFRMDIYH